MAKYPNSVSISMGSEMLDLIDEKRQDVPRSAFCRKMILKGLEMEVPKKKHA